MTAVTFPNGNSYSDDGTTAHDMRNGGHRTNLLPMIGDTITVANNAVTAAAQAVPAAATATTGATTATQQAAIATAAANTAASLVQVKQPSEIAGIDPVLDFSFSASTAVPAGVITGSSSKWVFNQAGVLVNVASGTAPIDFDPITSVVRGLLVEESRVNQVRNPRAEGSTVGTIGSGGVLPTNWVLLSAGGLSTAIVGTGTIGTAPYIDIRVSGTASGNYILGFDTGAAASSGQTWAGSAYVALVSGSLTGITATAAGVRGRNSSNSTVDGPNYGTSQTLTASLTRLTSAVALTVATVAYAVPEVRLVATVGAAIDCTLRVAFPQLELGSFATSPILPPAGSPAATTRSADVNTLLLSSIPGWNASEGTIYVEFDVSRTGASAVAVQIDDGGSQNRIIAQADTGSGSAGLVVFSGGATQASLTAGSVNTTTTHKLAVAWSSAGFIASLNGAAAVASSSGSIPSGLTTLRLGHTSAGSGYLNGRQRRITLFPRRLSSATLPLLTA